jgi:hypothetical protein
MKIIISDTIILTIFIFILTYAKNFANEAAPVMKNNPIAIRIAVICASLDDMGSPLLRSIIIMTPIIMIDNIERANPTYITHPNHCMTSCVTPPGGVHGLDGGTIASPV